jgi:hypothetical protein
LSVLELEFAVGYIRGKSGAVHAGRVVNRGVNPHNIGASIRQRDGRMLNGADIEGGLVRRQCGVRVLYLGASGRNPESRRDITGKLVLGTIKAGIRAKPKVAAVTDNR